MSEFRRIFQTEGTLCSLYSKRILQYAATLLRNL